MHLEPNGLAGVCVGENEYFLIVKLGLDHPLWPHQLNTEDAKFRVKTNSCGAVLAAPIG